MNLLEMLFGDKGKKKAENTEFQDGFYGTNDKNVTDRFLDEVTDDEIKAVLGANATDSLDVYGDSNYTGEPDWNPYIKVDDGKANILGLPPNFCSTADPNGRVYKSTIMQDLPYVFILPGKPRLNTKLIKDDGSKLSKSELMKQIEALDNDNPDSLKFAVKNAKNNNDIRFMGFKADYSDYFKYVQTMLSTVHATMGLKGIFNYADAFDSTFKSHGLCFYADKSTSISESASNDYMESSIVQKANDMSTASRELRNIVGWEKDIDDLEATNVEELTDALVGNNGILARVSSTLGRVVNGSQLLYPQIWADSKFDRSYTINFRFYSPYGDKESIFKYVYVPFISLLALSLPRQDSLLGYAQPFVLRLSCPGWFESSMGVVSSIQFTKGGNDSLWTKDNLPQEIEVNLNIQDLYPSLVTTKKFGALAYNLGLASFLDTMAGIRMDQLDLLLSSERFMKTRLTAPIKIFNEGFLSDFGYEIQQSINNILK